jgi:ankyrin repeat protein
MASAAPTRCAIDMRALGVDLLRAAAAGDVPKLREALVAVNAVDGVDVNVKNKYGGTALIWAAMQGHKECVALLLAVDGVDVNV